MSPRTTGSTARQIIDRIARQAFFVAWALASGSAVTACGGGSSKNANRLFGGGTVVDNGGDLLRCRPDAASPLQGDLMLDYAATFDPGLPAEDPNGDWPTLRARLTQIIGRKLPELADSWRSYVDLLENRDESASRIWRASALPLTDLADEDLVRALPANCKVERDGELVPDLKQLVRRRYFVDAEVPKLIYEYDADEFRRLKAQRPLQLAFLLTHEWLWDFVDSTYANRWINRLLNSTRIDAMTADAVRGVLRGYGVTGDAGGILGQPSPAAAELRNLFGREPACDLRKRYAVTFADGQARHLVSAGEELELTLDTPPITSMLEGATACGLGFLYSVRAVGGSAHTEVELRRGGAVETTAFDAPSGGVHQQLWHGVCRGADCLQRDGALAYFFGPNETGPTRWRLHVRVDATSSGRLELTLPHIVFVKRNLP